MARSDKYDDLDEMLVPQDKHREVEDDVDLGGIKHRGKTKKQQPLPPYQQQKKAEKTRQMTNMIVVAAVVFLALLGILIGVGLWMNERANPGGDEGTTTVSKADPALDKTMFLNESNLPEFSTEGVKGLLKEAYYTADGDLAVTLNLSNGTQKDHKVVRIGIRIFNAANETVAQQTVDSFDPACVVKAGERGEVYFLIDKSYVVLSDDSLSELGTTLEIGSTPTDGSGGNGQNDGVGDGPKDIAENRTYYENLGNIPELSAEGVKGSIIRARYTNDGSLAITLSLSNGTDADKTVSSIDFLLRNGDSGATIADYTFTTFEEPCTVLSQSYREIDLIVDAGYVSVADDALSTLSCTVNVSAG